MSGDSPASAITSPERSLTPQFSHRFENFRLPKVRCDRVIRTVLWPINSETVRQIDSRHYQSAAREGSLARIEPQPGKATTMRICCFPDFGEVLSLLVP